MGYGEGDGKSSKARRFFRGSASVFSDPNATAYEDPDHSTTEKRCLTFGTSAQGRLLVVSYANQGDRIRIITARKVTRRERDVYEEEER